MLEGLAAVPVPLAVVVEPVAELEVPEADAEAEAEVEAVELLLPAAATTPPRALPWGEVAVSTFLAADL